MAIRERGGMWCPACKRPVAGRKNGHAVRNVGGVLGAVPTFGLSLLATKSERWHCPICGGPVQHAAFRKPAPAPVLDEPATGTVALTLVDPGPKLIPAIKVYREITRLGLREAKAAIDGAPTLVGYFEPGEAARLGEAFSAVGATVQVADPTAGTADSEGVGMAAELAELARLHESGALSADEFAAAKARVLG